MLLALLDFQKLDDSEWEDGKEGKRGVDRICRGSDTLAGKCCCLGSELAGRVADFSWYGGSELLSQERCGRHLPPGLVSKPVCAQLRGRESKMAGNVQNTKPWRYRCSGRERPEQDEVTPKRSSLTEQI